MILGFQPSDESSILSYCTLLLLVAILVTVLFVWLSNPTYQCEYTDYYEKRNGEWVYVKVFRGCAWK